MMNSQTKAGLAEMLVWCRDQRERAEGSLASLAKGTLSTGRVENGEMIDTTGEYRAHLERVVDSMTSLIAVLERDLA